jgi:hypothetical protein
MRRFSIAAMMMVVLVCVVAVAALRNASDTWAGVMLLLTLVLLGISVLGVLQRRGAKRAFWQGFALFGWGYFTLTMGPWFIDHVRPPLATTQWLEYLHERLNESPHPTVEIAIGSDGFDPGFELALSRTDGLPVATSILGDDVTVQSGGQPQVLVGRLLRVTRWLALN